VAVPHDAVYAGSVKVAQPPDTASLRRISGPLGVEQTPRGLSPHLLASKPSVRSGRCGGPRERDGARTAPERTSRASAATRRVSTVNLSACRYESDWTESTQRNDRRAKGACPRDGTYLGFRCSRAARTYAHVPRSVTSSSARPARVSLSPTLELILLSWPTRVVDTCNGQRDVWGLVLAGHPRLV